VEVDIDAPERAVAGHREPVRVEPAVGAHERKEVAEQVTRLGRRRGPARDANPAARDERGGEEGPRVGQVRFDDPVDRGDEAGVDPPGVGVRVVDDHGGLAQGPDGHLDMRQARHRLADVVDGDALVVARRREEQPGDEL
jgi:hypothetical protein